MKNIPITYSKEFVPNHEAVFSRLWNELDWLDVAGPRLEYFVSDFKDPYTYGTGEYARTYHPQIVHADISMMRSLLEQHTGAKFELCFLNGYRDGKDQLNWHADDSPELDDDRPIAIISLGAKREIYFRPNPTDPPSDEPHIKKAHKEKENLLVEKLWLDSGSLCLMAPGMQDTHQHRIPKASAIVGPRISLTFRGSINVIG